VQQYLSSDPALGFMRVIDFFRPIPLSSSVGDEVKIFFFPFFIQRRMPQERGPPITPYPSLSETPRDVFEFFLAQQAAPWNYYLPDLSQIHFHTMTWCCRAELEIRKEGGFYPDVLLPPSIEGIQVSVQVVSSPEDAHSFCVKEGKSLSPLSFSPPFSSLVSRS